MAVDVAVASLSLLLSLYFHTSRNWHLLPELTRATTQPPRILDHWRRWGQGARQTDHRGRRRTVVSSMSSDTLTFDA